MATYSVWLERYATGRERRDPETWGIRTLTEARKAAFKSVAHKGMNTNGNYKAIIYSGPGNASDERVWEVVNTIGNTRYWYPEKGGKYELKSDGSIGKRLRW